MNRNSQSEDCVPKLRDRIREVTHDAIVKAAEGIFAEEGLHTARMESIAARAGVSVGTLYNHFKDRDAMLTALLQARHDELVARMDEAEVRAQGQPFREQLLGFYLSLLEHFDEHRKFLSILMQGEHSKSPIPPMGTTPRDKLKSETMREVFTRAERLVRRGVEEKALRGGETQLFPAFCIGVVRSVLVAELLDAPLEVPLAERAAQMVTFYLEGAGA